MQAFNRHHASPSPAPAQLKRFAYDCISSTQAIARDINTAPPWVVVAHQQTNGFGQRGNTWHSPVGNFYATYCWPLPQAASTATLPIASLAAAVAVQQALSCLGFHEITLKWPNDILLHHKKIAGLLLEVAPQGLLVGIGINAIAAPDIADCAYPAGHLQGSCSLATIEQALYPQLDHWLQRWASGAHKQILAHWWQHAAWQHQHVTLHDGNRQQQGVLTGIDDHGRLLLDTGSEIQAFAAGSLRHLPYQ